MLTSTDAESVASTLPEKLSDWTQQKTLGDKILDKLRTHATTARDEGLTSLEQRALDLIQREMQRREDVSENRRRILAKIESPTSSEIEELRQLTMILTQGR
jgi:hypothetical protein